MDYFGVEERFRVGFDELNQRPDQILRLRAGGADENPVPTVDVAEDFLLRDEFLRIGPLHLLAFFIFQF
jgi:hypothetical protein